MEIKTKLQLKQADFGPIPEDWEVLKVSDVAVINARTANKDYPFEEIEYLDTSSTEDGQVLEWQNLKYKQAPSRAKRILRDNDIVISTVRPNLKHFALIKKAKENSIASTGYAVITAQKADPRYLYYRLTTDDVTEHLSKIADTSTSTYPSIKPEVISEHEFFFPSLEEQKKIAEVLGALDDKIELNRKMNKTLESLGQAIFKRWFVDSGNYRIGKLSDIADITTGKRPEARSNEQTTEFSVPLIGAASVMGYTAKTLYSDQSDIIVTGRVGTYGVLQRINYPCWPSDNTLVTCSGIQNFVHQTMQTLDFHSLNKGSTQPLITQTDLKNFEINIPPKGEIEKYEQIAQPMTNLINKNNKEIETLSQIRNKLIKCF